MTQRQQLLALYQACFPEDDPAFWNWIFEKVYRPENTLNIFRVGRIVSSLQMIPCKLRQGSARFDAHYIYAAATLPEFQGRGLMAELLRQAAQEGIRRGQDFSVLITQEDSLLDYYARFGYQPRSLSGFGEPYTGPVTGRVCTAAPADIPVLNELYEQAAGELLHGVRDEEHWLLQLELFGMGARVLKREGSITAYAFSDERGILEAVGPDAAMLAAHLHSGCAWRTIPGKNARPMGSIKPLNEKSRIFLEQNPCFLNLMYN